MAGYVTMSPLLHGTDKTEALRYMKGSLLSRTASPTKEPNKNGASQREAVHAVVVFKCRSTRISPVAV